MAEKERLRSRKSAVVMVYGEAARLLTLSYNGGLLSNPNLDISYREVRGLKVLVDMVMKQDPGVLGSSLVISLQDRIEEKEAMSTLHAVREEFETQGIPNPRLGILILRHFRGARFRHSTIPRTSDLKFLTAKPNSSTMPDELTFNYERFTYNPRLRARVDQVADGISSVIQSAIARPLTKAA